MFRPSTEFLRHLEAEIQWLKIELKHERQRAEVAVDQLLRLKAGAHPVTPVETSPAREALQREVDELLNNPEFTQIGEVL